MPKVNGTYRHPTLGMVWVMCCDAVYSYVEAAGHVRYMVPSQELVAA